MNQKESKHKDVRDMEQNRIWGDYVVERMNQLKDREKDKDGLLFYEIAEEVGKKLVKNITMTQIRKIFSEIQKKSKQKEKINPVLEVKRIEVMMAYTVGRFSSSKSKSDWQSFFKVVKKASEMVIQNKWTFDDYKNFFEAIIAYYRYHGGREQ
ncbi:type III-A CRISPR-associated protein Csm2 [Anaerocellum danielii]|uniref:CRISPR system Cms protein Csm2 n=1 Tax=Anaerocellum danielii TaxID=1387557 RepID=A0ABZ0TZ55_9FIRM|nr:type III-A CRISPR-associated protein Csm2 [Caldicellulosiruptor danielii]WPX08757.1 type III-A CRISPR-associated protein Csm2 [Caldicellulosiruptor danielii]